MSPASAADWMGARHGGVRLSDLAIPGTHDTMTSPCGDPYYRTQNLALAEQLEVGVRFLDLRLTRAMVAAHREWISTIGFTEIQHTLAEFLHRHPGECVIARIQNANEAKDDYDLYADALKAAITGSGDLFTWFGDVTGDNPPWPTLEQVRGTVVAIECSPPALGVSTIDGSRWAADWHGNDHVRIQDDWDGPEPEDKLAAITAMATTEDAGDDQGDVLLLNHISATNGTLGNPLAYAERLNPATARLLHGLAENRSRGHVGGRGVYIFDFIDSALAEAVLALNAPPDPLDAGA